MVVVVVEIVVEIVVFVVGVVGVFVVVGFVHLRQDGDDVRRFVGPKTLAVASVLECLPH